jgi:hypothetical protein
MYRLRYVSPSATQQKGTRTEVHVPDQAVGDTYLRYMPPIDQPPAILRKNFWPCSPPAK